MVGEVKKHSSRQCVMAQSEKVGIFVALLFSFFVVGECKYICIYNYNNTTDKLIIISCAVQPDLLIL